MNETAGPGEDECQRAAGTTTGTRTYVTAAKYTPKGAYWLRHACPSVFPHNQRCSHWTEFREIWYWRLVRKSIKQFQIWLKSDKNMYLYT